MSLGSYLREIREERGFSLRDVERLAKEKTSGPELSSGYLSMLEGDKIIQPSPRILFALAGIYRIDYISLMKKAGYIPEKTDLEEHTPAPVGFRGADRLSEEQRQRVQRIIDLELQDSLRKRRQRHKG